jgi:hypothetical protein
VLAVPEPLEVSWKIEPRRVRLVDENGLAAMLELWVRLNFLSQIGAI